MRPEPQLHYYRRSAAVRPLRIVGPLLLALVLPAAAQDIRGLEVCTAEKQMERRTGCLQSNVEYLQQALAKLTRETQDKLAAAGRELATARAEIATLRAALAKLTGDLAELKAKAEPAGSKAKAEPAGKK
jgi:septal ring factor EnvC (AmiA/AmiB activator)